MKINVGNVERVETELAHEQGKSYAGIYNADAVKADAAEAEARLDRLHLIEAEKRGARWTGYARAAGGRTWREYSTVITLERGVGGRWFLTHVSRSLVHDGVRSGVRVVNARAETVAHRIAAVEGVELG